MKRVLSLFLSVLMLLSITAGMDFSALAADTYDIRVRGNCNYNLANEILVLVNEERAKVGKDPLKMDTELLDAAMIRGEELGLNFNHDRPDGSSIRTLNSNIHGENIAAGVKTAEDVMDLWMNSATHKSNILNSNFKSIGIGCFKNGENGIYYFAQCFSYYDTINISDKSGIESRTDTIAVLKENVQLYSNTYIDSYHSADYMYPNETGYFTYGVLNSGWDNHYSIGVPEDYVFTSSNPSVIEIDSYGKFKSKKDGKATLKVAMKDYPELSCTYDIIVKSEQWDPDQLSVSVSREWAYTGSPITPKPSFVLYGEYEILEEGKDYTVSYKNNVNPGTATMIITGCRKYKGTKAINFTITPPNPMQNIKIESTGTSVFITSDPVKDATGYEFYIDMGDWGLSMINTVPECEFDDLEPGKEYEIKVRAIINGKNTSWIVKTFTTKADLPKVTGLYTSARGGYGEKLKIEWNAQSGADSYNIYSYSKTNGWTKAASTKNNYYVFEDVVPGWEYYYKVAAVKNGVEGALSDEHHTCAACPPMDAPMVSLAGSNSIKVDWNIVNSHGYVIQWSTDSTFSKNLNSLYVTGHGKDSYTITTKDAAGKYYVRVRAWRNFEGGMVYGLWSSGSKLNADALYPVTGLYTSARGGYGEKLKIAWDAQNADSYNVYSYSKTNGWSKVASTKDNYYVFEDVVPGWEYYYKVAAVKNGKEGPLSEQLHTCAACPPMDAPRLTKTGTNTIKVDWTVVNSHGYVIQWSTDPTFSKDLNSLYVTGHDWNSYSIKTSGNASNYYVRVRAWRNFEGGMVYGIWSNPAKIG